MNAKEAKELVDQYNKKQFPKVIKRIEKAIIKAAKHGKSSSYFSNVDAIHLVADYFAKRGFDVIKYKSNGYCINGLEIKW